MRMVWAAGAAAAALAWSGAVLAASFDCRKAATPVERLVCADRELSRLDEEMDLAFRDALTLTPFPAGLREEQRQWLATRNRDPARAVVEDAYRFRIQALNERRTVDRRRRWHRRDRLEAECAWFALEACRVAEAGTVPGGEGLFYQLQRTHDDAAEGIGAGVVLFEQSGPDRLEPIAWAFDDGGVHYSTPRLVPTPAGALLVAERRAMGTGNFNLDLVMRRAGGRWRDVETERWRQDLGRRLGEGRYVAKGVDYDWGRLRVETPVWKDSDANCCPEGGWAEIDLGISDDRFVIRRLRFDPQGQERGR